MEIRSNIPSTGEIIDERDAYKSLYYQMLGNAESAYNLLEIILAGHDISAEHYQYELKELRKFWDYQRVENYDNGEQK